MVLANMQSEVDKVFRDFEIKAQDRYTEIDVFFRSDEFSQSSEQTDLVELYSQFYNLTFRQLKDFEDSLFFLLIFDSIHVFFIHYVQC